MAFLQRGNEPVIWLHQAQVSCIITGSNSSKWTGILCTDNYFDGEDSEDSPVRCQESIEDGIYGDPFLQCEADTGMDIIVLMFYTMV